MTTHKRPITAVVVVAIGLSISTPLFAGAAGSRFRHVRSDSPSVHTSPPPVVHSASTAVRSSLAAPITSNTGRWKLVFSDEFAGTSLASNWSICYPWSACVNAGNHGVWNEQEWYQGSNCVEQNGELDLRATAGNQVHPFLSCLIQSENNFSFTYGYVEARIWLPAAVDAWPALWLHPLDSSLPEIDVLEGLGGNNVLQVYHWTDGATGYRASGSNTYIAGATSGWHTYGLDWEPGSITWYIDGNIVKTITSADAQISNTSMYLILNLALGSFSPTPQVPAELRVDYVRVWQH